MAGYLACKALERHVCGTCTQAMCRNERAEGSQHTILASLKSVTGVDDADIGSLKQPTDAFLLFILKAYEIVQSQAASILHESGVGERVIECIMATSAAEEMRSMMCDNGVLCDAAARFVRLQLHVMCRQALAGHHFYTKGKQCRKLLKVSCRSRAALNVSVTLQNL